MMNKSFYILWVCFLCSSLAFAQQRTIQGQVKDDATDTPIAGATIRVEGSQVATSTTDNGTFTLEVGDGQIVLLVTSIGFSDQRYVVGTNENEVSIRMLVATDELEEVVVTALGIERKSKSLTYSTQSVGGEELARVRDANPMNNLTGRISGLQINRSASGIGGSVNIVLRGMKSNRNNQPLYVIDGMPISNTGGSGSTGAFGGNPDRGDILSTLNADDIASINVLKGASASALYGSQGANGAIMITTKQGQAGRTRIEISSGLTVDEAFYLPELQYRYGQSTPDSEENWGAPGTFDDPVKDFFDTGTTWINSVSMSGGTIGFPLTMSDRTWVSNYIRTKTSTHSFFPFIHRTSKVRRFRKQYCEHTGTVLNEGLRVASVKPRELYYASHLDAAIYSYYTQKLDDTYERFLSTAYFRDAILAYRQIPIGSY